MSSAERSSARPGPDLLLTVAVYASIQAALLPLLRVVVPEGWMLGAVLLPAVLLAAGYTARRYRLPAIAVTLIEAAVWMVVVCVIFLRDTALLGVIPTPGSVGQAWGYVEAASEEIVVGAAPLSPSVALSFVLVAAIGLLTIVIDHVVLTARMPLLAAVGLVPLSLISAIVVPAPADVGSFVLLSATLLLMIRAETRRREGAARVASMRGGSRGAAPAGLAATATGIGAIAVIVALVVAPALPTPAPQPVGFGPGGNSIDPTLQLGEDLRRPRDVQVLTLTTDAANPPYLRAATLTVFDGEEWQPDRGRSVTLGTDGALGPVGVDSGVRLTEFTTSIQVEDLVSAWLPITFPAVDVQGLDGDWAAIPSNRTVLSVSTNAAGQDYEVVSHVPRPSVEQIRGAVSASGLISDAAVEVPSDTPEIVADLAAEVTAAASNDFDRLVALQTWFRGADFEYSLEAPVQEGFDGSGAEAIAEFLEVRRGYCIHYAAAFALMARTLGMPSRIVVGYLPGNPTGETVDERPVYGVTSGQLHAWPEVRFEGIGWVPFEPTKSLGTPTTFAPASAPTPEEGTEVEPTARPTATATPTTSAPADASDPGSTADGPSTVRGFTGLPWVGLVLAILVVVALPAAVQWGRRRALLSAADRGDAVAAWRVFQDAAIDLGIPLPRGETPRGFGARMVADADAPPDAVALLVGAVERASYGRHGGLQFGDGPALAESAAEVRAAMIAAATPARRILAAAVPRSLVIQPGSVYAGAANASVR